jgi:hypothetical protein
VAAVWSDRITPDLYRKCLLKELRSALIKVRIDGRVFLIEIGKIGKREILHLVAIVKVGDVGVVVKIATRVVLVELHASWGPRFSRWTDTRSSSQSSHRVDSRGAARREITGDERY